jgi:hypothetical protein
MRKIIFFKKSVILIMLTPLLMNAESCYESTIVKPSPFMGNHGEIFKLSNGIIGEVKNEYEYMYEYYPRVIVCSDKNQLIVDEKKLNIELISVNNNNKGKIMTSIESQIDGEFKGFEGETIIKLINGEIWQQTEYYYHYHYAYMPSVLIFKSDYGYKMQVDGIDKLIGVTKLK